MHWDWPKLCSCNSPLVSDVRRRSMKYNFLSGLKLNGTVLKSCIRPALLTRNEADKTRDAEFCRGQNGRSEAILFFASSKSSETTTWWEPMVFLRQQSGELAHKWLIFFLLLLSWIFLVYDKIITAMLTACLSYDSTSNCNPLFHANVLISSHLIWFLCHMTRYNNANRSSGAPC